MKLRVKRATKPEAKAAELPATRAAAATPSDRLFRASLDFDVRVLDHDKREAEFVASTERPVKVGPWEPEVLRMAGVDLGRYKRNPVLLDSHNRFELGSVIGSCTVRVEGRKLIAVARYADTERGEQAWKLVKGGHVRAMSIGYDIDAGSVRKLREGETDGEGDGQINGPASVVNRWTLLEISNVPVPADADAVRARFLGSLTPSAGARPQEAPVKIKGRKKQLSKTAINFAALVDEIASNRDKPQTGEQAKAEAEQKAADGSESGPPEDGQETGKAERGDGMEVECPHCGKTFDVELPERTADEVESAPNANGGDQGSASGGAKILQLPGQKRAAEREALQRSVRAITPRGLEPLADQGLLEGLSFEAIRAGLLEAQAARMRPLGTPEPRDEKTETRTDKLPAEVTDEVLVRSLESLG